MGKVMYPMIKCHPDISTHTIILSQYMNQPGEDHYLALHHLVTYLSHTASEGIHYWCPEPINTLPWSPLPCAHSEPYVLQERLGTESQQLVAFVYSDWATNTRKHTSMTGMVLLMSGGAIGYKSKFQMVIAHSSTEAEFVATCDTGKMILFSDHYWQKLEWNRNMPQSCLRTTMVHYLWPMPSNQQRGHATSI